MVAVNDVQARIQSDIEALCRFPRGSATEGEMEAARWVASDLREAGLQAELETFEFYPAYWDVWGAHMLGALGSWLVLSRGSRRRRLLGAALTSFLTASFWGDTSARFYWLRSLFPAHPSANVLAKLPNPDASRVLVVSAHVDAAHPGLVFHPRVLKSLASRYSGDEVPPALILPFRGLLSLTAASILRAIGFPRIIAKAVALPGVFISLATAGFMADIRSRPAVPGANDDASGVASVLALARDLVADPPKNLEVWFLVTGCEEAIEGGIHAFLNRHKTELEGRRPFFLNLEMLGSGRPGYSQAEGHVTVFRMLPEATALLDDVAQEPEFLGARGVTSPAQSDALAAHHQGYPAVTVMSQPPEGEAPHYHWPDDTPQNIDVTSLGRCYRYIRRAIQLLDEREG